MTHIKWGAELFDRVVCVNGDNTVAIFLGDKEQSCALKVVSNF